jgi:hypothetical protein
MSAQEATLGIAVFMAAHTRYTTLSRLLLIGVQPWMVEC